MMNRIEKFAVPFFVKLADLLFDADEWIEKKTGKGLVDRMTDSRKKDEALREKNYIIWAAKKLAIGTIKGITGATLTNND